MTAKQNPIMIVATALILSGAVFAVGYSMRPSAIRAQADAGDSNETPAIVVPHIGNVAAPSESAMFVAQQVTMSDPSQTHSGIIVSMNGQRFILRDDANDTWYHLDDQQAAASYLGKKVKITGDIDPATDVIHVQSIEEEKA